MIEPVYVPYEQYRAAKTRCRLDSRIYGILHTKLYGLVNYCRHQYAQNLLLLPDEVSVMPLHSVTVVYV
jgi:hypothetical protein